MEGVLDLLIAENASLCADLRNGLGATKAGIDEDCIEADAVVAFLDLQEQLTAFRQAFIDLSSGMTDVLGLIHSPRDMPPEIAQRVARFLATVRGELPDLTAGSKALGEVWHEFCQLTDPSMKDAAAAFGRYHALVAAAGPDGAARS